MARCTATNRQGDQCGRQASPNKSVCASHGSKSLAGAGHPNFRHGRYSKMLPANLAGRFEAALADPDLLGLSREIALTDTRIGELVEGLAAGGGAGETWAELTACLRRLTTARDRGDLAVLRATLLELAVIVESGQAGAASWDEVLRLVSGRARLVEIETKRRVQAQEMITAAEASALISAVADSVRRHVSDPRVLTAIATEFDALFRRQPGAPALPERTPPCPEPHCQPPIDRSSTP